MFNSEIPMARHPYYVMTTDMDWFVQIRTDGECLLTGDIDGIFGGWIMFIELYCKKAFEDLLGSLEIYKSTY